MPRFRNAFKIRAADAPIMDTSQFLQLYCPLILDQLERDDLLVPKLIVVRGSPGIGKSSLLRLFETDTLLTIHSRRSQPSDPALVERLLELGILSESGPKILGIYIQCDSSLRDIANLPHGQGMLRLFDTLLDIRILVSFLRALRRLAASGCLDLTNHCVFYPLPSSDTPPSVFARKQTIEEVEKVCAQIEQDFGTLLNSFPDDPLPSSIQPHARVFALNYLALQIQNNPALSDLIPVVMLDDVQELYPEQREHLKDEFIRRAAIPRWLAVRTHVFGIEDLISLEGAEQGREYREIRLDEIFQDKPSVFNKFSANVMQRRLQATESLQQISVADFKDFLRPPDETISQEQFVDALKSIIKQASDLHIGQEFLDRFKQSFDRAVKTPLKFEDFVEFEKGLIVMERLINRGQQSLFPNLDLQESTDTNGKTEDAARLFACRRLHRPYFFGFETLSNLASGNVEQFLSIAAALVDRLIYRAELDRSLALSAKQQEEILKKCAGDYYETLEKKHRRGLAIRQFVDNLGKFCESVTTRPNAPIAPGVNGFGLTRREIQLVLKSVEQPTIFREVITNAVAGNVLSVRITKQGQAGIEKIVFYLNRLLCVKFDLPLNYGGWQHLPLKLLIRMMQEPVPLQDMANRRSASGSLF